MTRVVLVMCLIDWVHCACIQGQLGTSLLDCGAGYRRLVGLLQLFEHAERSSSSRVLRDRRGLRDADRGPPTSPAVYSAAVSPVCTGASFRPALCGGVGFFWCSGSSSHRSLRGRPCSPALQWRLLCGAIGVFTSATSSLLCRGLRE